MTGHVSSRCSIYLGRCACVRPPFVAARFPYIMRYVPRSKFFVSTMSISGLKLVLHDVYMYMLVLRYTK